MCTVSVFLFFLVWLHIKVKFLAGDLFVNIKYVLTGDLEVT